MALRDSTIAVNWDIGGVSELNQSEDKIQDAADEAEELEQDVESAGDEMEATGQKGQDAFMGISDAVDDISFGGIAAGGGVVAAGGGAALQSFANAAGDVEEARTAIQAQAGGQADRLIREARAYERWSNSAVAATDIMESQRMLLRSDALSGETVGDLTGALSNLAVAYNRDLRDVFEEVRDPLFEAEGATQLVTKGFIRNQEEIFRSIGVWEDGIRTFRKYREEMGTAASRQLIINELIRKGRREQDAASQQLQTFNQRWEGFTNELDRSAAVMGGELAKEQKGFLGRLTEQLRQTRLTERGTLAMVGKTLAFATAAGLGVAAVGTFVGGLTLMATALGGISLGLTGIIALLSALAGIIAIDLAGSFITGESFLVDWGDTLDWWMGLLGDAVDEVEDFAQSFNLIPEPNEVPMGGQNQMNQTPGMEAGTDVVGQAAQNRSMLFDISREQFRQQGFRGAISGGLAPTVPVPDFAAPMIPGTDGPSLSQRDRTIIHRHLIESDDTDPDTKKTSEAIAEEVGRLLQKQQSVEVEGAK